MGQQAVAVRASFSASLMGVNKIRFEFPTGQENLFGGLGEIDIIGTATAVPEPSAARSN